MDNKKIASELVKLAKVLIAGHPVDELRKISARVERDRNKALHGASEEQKKAILMLESGLGKAIDKVSDLYILIKDLI